MPHVTIDGQKLNFNFNFEGGSNAVREAILKYLEAGLPFILHEGNKDGPIIIPEKLAVIEQGQVLIHSSIAEFQFSISWYAGLYSRLSSLEQKELSYVEQKLLGR